MAESPHVEILTEYSPAIPEVQCPSTPGPQLGLKSPELSSSSSSEETEVTRGDGTQSPPPNCAICLGRCRNKCFTDSCMHQFCFKCLLEWSKVKPECPLCKQTFKAIIHNVKSIHQFEEYLVQPAIPDLQNSDPYSVFSIPPQLYQRVPVYTGRANLYLDDYSTGNTLDLTGTSSSTSNGNQNTNRTPVYRRNVPGPAQLMDMYSQETMQGETGSGSLSQLWRRYVYDRKLYALPMQDITGHVRESSARFYRDHMGQLHRLMPWINRDIICLLRNTEHEVDVVMEQIKTMLLTCNILSPEFRRRLTPILGTKTVHFIHELNNFARSPFDIIGYDRVVQYSANNAEEIVIEFSSTSSAGSDVESVNNDIQPDAATTRRILQRSLATNANSGGGFNLYTTTTTSTSSQASAINLSTHNRGASGEENTTMTTVEIVNAPISERPTNIVLSSSSSDECEFVLEQKPPHLRTPEMVSLNSDSDSDVVFVQETKTTPMPSGITKWASTNHGQRTHRTQRRRTKPAPNNHTFSTSNSDSDSYTYGDASTPKKLKIDETQETLIPESSATSADLSCKSSNDQVAKVKEEFNQGASTSTGLQSRYRSARPHITRTRRHVHTETSDSEVVNESSSSVISSCYSSDESNSSSDSDTSWSKTRRKSNKQSLKRSRQQKAATNSRKTRRQATSSSKSKRAKRSKSSKTPATKSPSSLKKKKTSNRSRRKSPKTSKSVRRKRQSPPSKHSTTEEEPYLQTTDYQPVEEMERTSSCTVSSSDFPLQPHSDHEHSQQTPPNHLSSSASSSISNSTSDFNEPAEDFSLNAPLAAGDDSFNSADRSQLPTRETSDNPSANLAIYSDTD